MTLSGSGPSVRKEKPSKSAVFIMGVGAIGNGDMMETGKKKE